jgi:hypothetical protein
MYVRRPERLRPMCTPFGKATVLHPLSRAITGYHTGRHRKVKQKIPRGAAAVAQ